MGKGLGCGGRGLSRGNVWEVGGANGQDPQGWKRPWGLFGVGLRLKTQKGHRHVPHPWSQRAGDLTWEPSRLPGLLWAGQLPSASLLLLLDGSSHLPLLMSSASLLCPQDPCGLAGALEGGYWLGSSAGCPARVGGAIALLSSPALPRESLPPASPDLGASGAPILSGLHFSSPLSPPTSYQFTLGFLPSPWASVSPTSCQQNPWLWGDANSPSSHTTILTPFPSEIHSYQNHRGTWVRVCGAQLRVVPETWVHLAAQAWD